MDAPPELASLAQRLSAALEPLAGIQVAYLFGSRARGTARADSDLDLAVQLDSQLNGGGRAKLLLDVLDAMVVALGPLGERVDLLDLDRASPTVAFRVIREGTCLISRTARARIRLEARVARQYDDTRPHRELFQQAARAAAERMQRGALDRP
jgi:predicted nucleotidyltransferase